MKKTADVIALQGLIVDALEDVKGKDIVVFDTEHLSALFERVIIVSGSSNRQTKALASSVRDQLRDAGYPKPRVEGESNGEWIIVDCGSAVVHVMQPIIREYYRLEEIWGEKPVRIKLTKAKGLVKASADAMDDQPAKKAVKKTTPAKKTTSKKPVAKKATVKAVTTEKKTASKTATTKKVATKKAPMKKVVINAPKVAKKTPAAKKVTSTPKAAVKKAPAKKVAAKKAPAKTPARKPAAKK
ncbi:MAG: ribosome silencing factor [Burkholderiaceae bacterium]|jgi:ribosome-associated protein